MKRGRNILKLFNFKNNQRNLCNIRNKTDSAKNITIIGMSTNIFLGISKGITGIYCGSAGLIADSANSIGDVLTDIVVYYTLIKSRIGTTPDKPWGYGKIEPLGTLLVGSILVATGAGIGYNSLMAGIEIASIQAAIDTTVGVAETTPTTSTTTTTTTTDNNTINSIKSFDDIFKNENLPLISGIFVSTLSAATKEFLFHKTLKIGYEINSSIIIANAWHHRSDSFISMAVLIGLFGTSTGYLLLDPLIGILLSGIICKQGVVLLIDSVKDLTDSTASKEDIEILERVCKDVPGVLSLVSLQTRLSGPYIFVNCIIGVSNDITVSTSHHIAEQVKYRLIKHTTLSSGKNIIDAMVHVDPIGSSDINYKLLPKYYHNYMNITDISKDIVMKIEGVIDISHIFISYHNDGTIKIKLDIVINDSYTIKEAYNIAKQARIKLENKLYEITKVNNHEVDIDMELKDRD